jgi:hypothetical protein
MMDFGSRSFQSANDKEDLFGIFPIPDFLYLDFLLGKDFATKLRQFKLKNF